MYKVDEAIEVKVLLLDDNGNAVNGTINYIVYDETDTAFDTGEMAQVSAITGFYTLEFTPDAIGEWSIFLSCSIPSRVALKVFSVGKGIEKDIIDEVLGISSDVVSAIEDIGTVITYLNNETYGLEALQTLIGIVIGNLSDPNIYKADVSDLALEDTLTAIKGVSWSDETLVAIKAAIDDIDISSLARETTLDEMKGVSWDGETLKSIKEAIDAIDISSLALEATLTDIKGTGWSDETLVAIKASIDSIDLSDLALETTLTAIKGNEWSIETLKAIYDKVPSVAGLALESTLTNVTYGLEALKDLIDAVQADLDNPNQYKADVSTLALEATLTGGLAKIISHIDFWSITTSTIAITATADQDYNLPDVVVPALPTGFTIYKVYLIFKCALIRDSSGANNGIDEAGLIRIKASGDETFDGDGVTAYAIEDNMWLIDVTNVGRDRGGDAFVSGIDISGKVIGAGTYNIRLDSISADGSNLNLHDICVGLRIYFY